MTVVVDAGAAIEIALDKEFASQFQEIIKEADLVLAPDTFPAEVTNVFWKYAAFSGFPINKCQSGISFCLDLVDDYVSVRYLCHEVFSESFRSKHSAYDIFYLIVARRSDASILTRDRGMSGTAMQLGVKVAAI